MINFSLIDVKNIASNVPRANFNESELENLADLIVETGGVIKPLVVKLNGPENYILIEGHFEYYAAVRAREKDPRKCEMVNAFIISPKLENLILKQIEALTSTSQSLIVKPEITNVDSSLIKNLELRFEKQINELKAEILYDRQRMDEKFKQIDNIIAQPNNPPDNVTYQSNNPLNLLNKLDIDGLLLRLKRSRISSAEKLAKAIFEARNKKPNKAFEDYHDLLISVKGLGEKTILTIIDEWSKN